MTTTDSRGALTNLYTAYEEHIMTCYRERWKKTYGRMGIN
jgi:hypothetical protein